MWFPDSAKQAIAKAFYDKEVAVYALENEYNSEGGAVKKISTDPKSTFKGNAKFVTFGEQQTEKGLLQDIDIQITCPTDTAVEVDDIVQYNAVNYRVVSVLPADSHLTVEAQQWLER